MAIKRQPIPGDQVKILKGPFVGQETLVASVNYDRGSVTLAIPPDWFHETQRHKYYINKNNYVPMGYAIEDIEVFGNSTGIFAPPTMEKPE